MPCRLLVLALTALLGACAPPLPALRSVEVIGGGGRVTSVASSEAAGIVCAAGVLGVGVSENYWIGGYTGNTGGGSYSFVHCESGPGRPLFTQIIPAASSFVAEVGIFDEGVVVVSLAGLDVEGPFGLFDGAEAVAYDATGTPLWQLPGSVDVMGGLGLHLSGRSAAPVDSMGNRGAAFPVVPEVAGGSIVIEDLAFDRDFVYVASRYDPGFSPDIDAFRWTGEPVWHADSPTPGGRTMVSDLALLDRGLFVGLAHLDERRRVVARSVREIRVSDGTPSGAGIDDLPIGTLGYHSLCALPGALGITREQTFYVAAADGLDPVPALTVTATGSDHTYMTDCAAGPDGEALVVGNFWGLTESFGSPLESGPDGAMYIASVAW